MVFSELLSMESLIEKVKRMISELNQECFNGRLNLSFPIKISNTSKNAAHVSFIGKRNICEVKYSVFKFSLSKNFNWTDGELKSTILHELIHIYEAQILEVKPSHGQSFKAKMNQLNKDFNYNVSLKHQMKSTKERKIKWILSEKNDRIVFVSDSLFSKILLKKEQYLVSFGNFKTGTISSSLISSYSVARKFKYSYRINEETLKKIGIL